jgi:putative Holliday junction resolvase
MVPPAPRPAGPASGKPGRKLHALPIASNLEAWLAELPASDAGRPGLIGLDVSRKAIGVAGADASWRLATPLATIRRRRFTADLAGLQATIAERDAAALVLGWPLNMDGSEGPRCQSVRAFAERLEHALRLPILLWDERLSTFAAEEAADQAGLRARKRADRLDALAAAIILQGALDALARLESQAAPKRPRRA